MSTNGGSADLIDNEATLSWRLTRLSWGALFLVLTGLTGTTGAAAQGDPRVVNQVLTIVLIFCTLVLSTPAGTNGQPKRYISLFIEAWARLPPWVPLCALAWMGCLAWATAHSTLPSLSVELAGFQSWNLLLCALAYAYATLGRRIGHLVGGVLVSLDLCLLVGAAQFFAYYSNPHRINSFQAQHNTVISLLNDTNHFGLYLAALLPLALWDAWRAANAVPMDSTEQAGIDPLRPAAALWDLWRKLRPGIVIALGTATTSRSNWGAALVGMGIFFWLQRRADKGLSLRPFAPGLGVGLALSMGIVVLQSTWIRVHLGQTLQPEYMSSMGRGTIWHNEIRMFHLRPLTGWGPGTFCINYPQFLLPTQFHEMVLEGHNLYLHRLVEEGAPALLAWLAFVVGIWACGLKAAIGANPALPGVEDDQACHGLTATLCSCLLAYGICAIFVMPEQTPTLTVTFYLFVALLAALRWGWAPADASRRASPVFIKCMVALATVGFLLHVPLFWHADNGELSFDSAMQTKSLTQRIDYLRDAIAADDTQPEYWAQLGWAEQSIPGPASGEAAIADYQAALRRFPDDGVFWHNLAALSDRNGNFESAARCERRAIQCDPIFYLYHQSLAKIYRQTGDAAGAIEQDKLAARGMTMPIASPDYPPTPNGCQLPSRYRRVVSPLPNTPPKAPLEILEF